MSRMSSRKSVQALVLVLAFAVVGGLATTLVQARGSASPAAKALAKISDDWSAAALSRDAERVASFYSEDTVVYPPNQPVLNGREAAKGIWTAYFEEPSLRISWKTEHAEVSESGEMGFTAGPYALSVNGPDGKTIHQSGKYLCVWKRQKDGTWKAVHDMWNADSQ